MTEGEQIFKGILESKYQLERMNVVPDRVELTRAQYDALKAHCMTGMTHTTDDTCSSLLDLKIVIKEEEA